MITRSGAMKINCLHGITTKESRQMCDLLIANQGDDFEQLTVKYVKEYLKAPCKHLPAAHAGTTSLMDTVMNPFILSKRFQILACECRGTEGIPDGEEMEEEDEFLCRT